MDEVTLTLSSPMTEEQWDMIADYDFNYTNEITFHTKHGKTVRFVKESAQPEIIRCKECLYYDPPHVEDAGIRYEYKDMPKDAFDELGTGLVHIGYGVNIGGRCCRDYNKGYSDDKRVFVDEMNYCGRAERREDEAN